VRQFGEDDRSPPQAWRGESGRGRRNLSVLAKLKERERLRERERSRRRSPCAVTGATPMPRANPRARRPCCFDGSAIRRTGVSAPRMRQDRCGRNVRCASRTLCPAGAGSESQPYLVRRAPGIRPPQTRRGRWTPRGTSGAGLSCPPSWRLLAWCKPLVPPVNVSDVWNAISVVPHADGNGSA
jgi:hypothetical protein